jgi:hypothetical protein
MGSLPQNNSLQSAYEEERKWPQIKLINNREHKIGGEVYMDKEL